jgi:hypothetical protein
MPNPPNVYQDNGYKSRKDYLANLAEEYLVPLRTVELLADTLGEDEDFDQLVTVLEDERDRVLLESL